MDEWWKIPCVDCVFFFFYGVSMESWTADTSVVYGCLDPESLPLETLPHGDALAVGNEGHWQTVAR